MNSVYTYIRSLIEHTPQTYPFLSVYSCAVFRLRHLFDHSLINKLNGVKRFSMDFMMIVVVVFYHPLFIIGVQFFPKKSQGYYH